MRLPELRTQLHRTFRNDWQSYRGLTLDERGMLVAGFAVDSLGETAPANVRGRSIDHARLARALAPSRAASPPLLQARNGRPISTRT